MSASILLTGAAGALGTMLRPALAAAGHRVRLTDQRRIWRLDAGEDFVRGKLADVRAMRRAVAGVSTIIHLGGSGGWHGERQWQTVIDSNVTGMLTLFEAARAAGVHQYIFASSMHVLGLHPRSAAIDENSLPAPDTRYGVSKLWGEGLCRLYAQKYGLAVRVLRIGHAVADMADAAPGQGISFADLARLFLCAIEHPPTGFDIWHGVAPHADYPLSDGRLARDYGFSFADHGPDAATIFARLAADPTRSDAARRHHGGDFADFP
ncbi:MAG: NAD(P)-dependent oxidoreductase [Sphingomonadaceae bacterium]|nr:NAD(P)-dependent oxidoreductase [Sphingomonadaceae bacterium]